MTVRVFLAWTESEWLPAKVLEFSILEATRHAVEVRTIASFGRAVPVPLEPRNQPRTPFSFHRFLIPELCSFRGRAIYLDADMQVFADIAELWNAPMGKHDLLTVREGTAGRKGQFSVVLLDCARLRWRIEEVVRGLDEGRYTYEQLMHEMCIARSVGRTLDPAWNSLERFEPGRTRLLHYTDMDTQPWVSLRNGLAPIWLACLQRAIAAGFLSMDDVAGEVAAGHVRPSLLLQLPAVQAADIRLLQEADKTFVAPYRSIRGAKASLSASWRARLGSIARRGAAQVRGLLSRP